MNDCGTEKKQCFDDNENGSLKQRKVVITTTYNEMGIIIDTKAEEVAQPNLQPTCNKLATDAISRKAAIDIVEFECGEWRGLAKTIVEEIEKLSSAQPERNNHTVACMLAELFDDTCACNYNGIDEWLREKCELLDSCPNPAGVACWEQFLKHRAERRIDGGD